MAVTRVYYHVKFSVCHRNKTNRYEKHPCGASGYENSGHHNGLKVLLKTCENFCNHLKVDAILLFALLNLEMQLKSPLQLQFDAAIKILCAWRQNYKTVQLTIDIIMWENCWNCCSTRSRADKRFNNQTTISESLHLFFSPLHHRKKTFFVFVLKNRAKKYICVTLLHTDNHFWINHTSPKYQNSAHSVARLSISGSSWTARLCERLLLT